MEERDWLAGRFEEHRTHLRAVAYGMLGSLGEADDAVQEAWLRLSRSDADEIDNLGAWLTTVVARVTLNMLRSRNTRREEPLGEHIPDPIVDPADGTDPEHEVLLADSVGLALLIVLETLSPAERLPFGSPHQFRPPSGSRSSSTTCSPCRSTRSRRSSTGRPKRRASLRAVHGDGCRASGSFPTPTSTVSARSSMRSSPRPARATSMLSSPCSTPTSCCTPTSVAAGSGRSAARRLSRARPRLFHGWASSFTLRSSTAPSAR